MQFHSNAVLFTILYDWTIWTSAFSLMWVIYMSHTIKFLVFIYLVFLLWCYLWSFLILNSVHLLFRTSLLIIFSINFSVQLILSILLQNQNSNKKWNCITGLLFVDRSVYFFLIYLFYVYQEKNIKKWFNQRFHATD